MNGWLRKRHESQAALGEAQVVYKDAKQAKDALLPSLAYNNHVSYT
jgi:hypothetical protein